MMVNKQVSKEIRRNWRDFYQMSMLGLQPSSISDYFQDLQVFIDWFEAENEEAFSPEKLSNFDLHAFRAFQIDSCGVKPATWNRRLASMNRFQQWCQDVGFIQYDVMDGIKRMREQELAPRWLVKRDYARFMRQVELKINTAQTDAKLRDALRNQAMVALMSEAGLRIEEVVSLKRQDIKIFERSGTVFVRNGKGNKAAEVKLSARARRMISPWFDLCGEKPFAISKRRLEQIVKQLFADAGCEDDELTAHSLRHTAIRHFYERTRDIVLTCAFARHSDIRQTRRYTIPSREELADAVEGM